jgi:hypothetical protein
MHERKKARQSSSNSKSYNYVTMAPIAGQDIDPTCGQRLAEHYLSQPSFAQFRGDIERDPVQRQRQLFFPALASYIQGSVQPF